MKRSWMEPRRLALGATTALAALVGAQAAQAAAISYATLDIDNFQFFRGNGTQYDASNFDILEVANFSKAEATLNGSGVTATNPSNVALQCVGLCAGIGQNDFSQQPGTGYFARGDAVLTGAGISGAGPQNFVNTTTVAEVQLDSDGSGASGSNTGTGTRFSFNLTTDDIIDIQFDATPFLRAMLTDQDVMTFASVAWSISLQDSAGNTVFSWSPNGIAGGILGGTELTDPFSLNTSVSTLSPNDVTFNPGTGQFRAQTGLLSSSQTYTLSINHENAANAELEVAEVPEPAMVGAFGLSLMGLAAVARRRRRD